MTQGNLDYDAVPSAASSNLAKGTWLPVVSFLGVYLPGLRSKNVGWIMLAIAIIFTIVIVAFLVVTVFFLVGKANDTSSLEQSRAMQLQLEQLNNTLVDQSSSMQMQMDLLNKTYTSQLEKLNFHLIALSNELTESKEVLLLLNRTFQSHADNLKAIDDESRRGLAQLSQRVAEQAAEIELISDLRAKVLKLETAIQDLMAVNQRANNDNVKSPAIQPMSSITRSKGERLHFEPLSLAIPVLSLFYSLMF